MEKNKPGGLFAIGDSTDGLTAEQRDLLAKYRMLDETDRQQVLEWIEKRQAQPKLQIVKL